MNRIYVLLMLAVFFSGVWLHSLKLVSEICCLWHVESLGANRLKRGRNSRMSWLQESDQSRRDVQSTVSTWLR